MNEAWFSALGEPLGDAARSEIAAYLSGLAMASPVHRVSSWNEAFEICARPAPEWWQAEEEERSRLESAVKLDPADPEWLALNETLLARPRAIRSSASTPYTPAVAGRWAYAKGDLPFSE